MRNVRRFLLAFLIAGSVYLPDAVAAQHPIASGEDFCALVIKHANAGTLEKLVTDKLSNVQIGQQRMDLEAGTGGSADVPYVQALDVHTHAPIDIDLLHEKDGGDYWGGDNLGFISQNNIVQILYYTDFHHPIYTIPVNGGASCHFKVLSKEVVGLGAKEPELCQKP